MNAKHECLSDALCAAQAEFPAIVKEKVANTGKYAYAYADIADVIAAVTPVLAKHGLCQLQRMAVQNGQQLLVSELRHKAESVASEMLLPIEGVDPQSVGKVITYYRRYALQALLGVAAETDDDAADMGEARYNIEGYEVSPKGWIEDARRASHARQGQALLEWWAGYRQTREMIYRRHEAHRDALAELSAEIKERATAAQAPREPADILRAG
jgi:hypothetical protein